MCKNLIIKLKSYDKFISNWITSTHIYKKRAAFTLIASSVVHNKTITNDTIDDYLRIIQEYSDSEHEYVRKAISWALREIGNALAFVFLILNRTSEGHWYAAKEY